MSIPFLFSGRVIAKNDHFTLDEASSRHCLLVLRMKPGDPIVLTDGNGSCMEAVITSGEKKICTVQITEVEKMPPAVPKIALGISFTKNIARIEWFLEKATEIGISEIYPLICKRTEKIHYKFPRLQQILVSAMLQSQQYYLPVLHQPTPIEKLIRGNTYAMKYIAHCEKSDRIPLTQAMLKGKDSLMMVGPEGDFTEDEIMEAKGMNFIPVSLGSHRLRTETAGIVACTLLNTTGEGNI